MTQPTDDLKTTTPKTEELQTLAAYINHEYRLALEHAQTATEHAMNVGDGLLQAKTNIRHGHFADWLDENFAGSARTAQRWMRLAKRRPELEAKAPRVADLTIRAADALLTEPSDESEDDPAWWIEAAFADDRDELLGRLGEHFEIALDLGNDEHLFSTFQADGQTVDAFFYRAEPTEGGATEEDLAEQIATYHVVQIVSQGEGAYARATSEPIDAFRAPAYLHHLGLPYLDDPIWTRHAGSAYPRDLRRRAALRCSGPAPRYRRGA